MIIGDGIVLGAGGTTASIVVTAPTGSTVTCTTPSGIVMTAAEVSGTWTFAKLKVYGTYTITATDEMNTKTQDVLVDSADVYNVKIIYLQYIIKDGYLPEGVNLVKYDSPYYGNLPSVSLDPFVCNVSGAGSIYYDFKFSEVPALYNNIIKATIYSGSGDLMFGIGYGEYNIDGQFTRVRADSLNSSTVLSLNITNKNNLSKIWFSVGGHTVGASGSISIRDIWVE